ncbi:MAG: DedA family protein [Steroidobacteraceae bacterium]
MFGQFVHHVVATWGYYAVFAFCTLEGFGLFFVPGETTLIAASIAAAGALTRAPHHLNIIWVLAVAFCGAILGDNFSFWIGHRFGFGLLRRYGHYLSINLKRLKVTTHPRTLPLL